MIYSVIYLHTQKIFYKLIKTSVKHGNTHDYINFWKLITIKKCTPQLHSLKIIIIIKNKHGICLLIIIILFDNILDVI